MVNYSRIEHGMEITDFPELDAMENAMINSYFEEAQEKSVDFEIDEIYVFGSWARGTALKGESDLDFMIFLNEAHLDPNFDVMSSEITWGVEEKLRKKMPDYSMHWFLHYDGFIFARENKTPRILDKMGDTRGERFEGERRVYNLTEKRYMKENEFRG